MRIFACPISKILVFSRKSILHDAFHYLIAKKISYTAKFHTIKVIKEIGGYDNVNNKRTVLNLSSSNKDFDKSNNKDIIATESDFLPKFDGQLYFGLEADDDGIIKTDSDTVKQITSKFESKVKNIKIDQEALQESIKSDSPTNVQTNSNFIDQEIFSLELSNTSLTTDTFFEERERATLKRAPIISRTVPLGVRKVSKSDPFTKEELSVKVWEMENPSNLVEHWMTGSISDKDVIGDPFGVVMWPGSILAAQEMAVSYSLEIQNKTVLVLGAGCGVESQFAAMLGAKKVIAADINKFTLSLLEYGAKRAGYGDIIETRSKSAYNLCSSFRSKEYKKIAFDLFSKESLPNCDFLIAADTLYNEHLAKAVGKRCIEALQKTPKPPQIILTDSQKFHGTDFLREMINNGNFKQNLTFSWEERILKNMTGSGILIVDDQTYDVKGRILRANK